MNELNDSGLNAYLRRRWNIVDTAVPAGSLAPEVFPVVIAAPASQEDRLLAGEYLCAGQGLQTGVAAEYTAFRLANIAGSGMLLLVDRIITQTDGGNSVLIGLSPSAAALTTQCLSGLRDGRILPSTVGRQTAGVLTRNTSIAPPLGLGKQMHLHQAPTAYAPVVTDFPAVVPPGTSLDIGIAQVNQLLIVTVYWRERRAQPSELG